MTCVAYDEILEAEDKDTTPRGPTFFKAPLLHNRKVIPSSLWGNRALNIVPGGTVVYAIRPTTR